MSPLIAFFAEHSRDFGTLQLWAILVFFSMCLVEGTFTRPRLPLKPTPDLVTDLWYWLLSPALHVVARVVAGGLFIAILWLAGATKQPDFLHGFGPIASQPSWLIVVELVLLMDLVTYFTHRVFHAVPWLWRFHAIHHCATNVRWSTTGRLHPLNDVINYAVVIVPFALVGFPLGLVLPLLPAIMIYALIAHSQLRTDYGPLRTLLVSPRFHRFHHTHSDEGGNKNFANVFSIWDRMFGTYYLPEGRIPERFGLDTERLPESYLAQLLYPFRSKPRAAQTPAEPGVAESALRASPSSAPPRPAS